MTTVRVVICDEDALLREMVESLLTRLGFEIVGIADTTSAGVGLVTAARPDVVLFDMALGYNTDFDVLQAAIDAGARTIVFSHTADDAILSSYSRRPTVVPKPDLARLEQVLGRLERDEAAGVVEQDRRARPTRAASGDAPTGVTDAQAFYSALQDVTEGDALLSLEVPEIVNADALATALLEIMRGTDRLLASRTAVRIFLPAGGEDAIRSFLARMAAAKVVPDACRATAIVVRPGEAATDVFDRLRDLGEPRSFPAAD